MPPVIAVLYVLAGIAFFCSTPLWNKWQQDDRAVAAAIWPLITVGALTVAAQRAVDRWVKARRLRAQVAAATPPGLLAARAEGAPYRAAACPTCGQQRPPHLQLVRGNGVP